MGKEEQVWRGRTTQQTNGQIKGADGKRDKWQGASAKGGGDGDRKLTIKEKGVWLDREWGWKTIVIPFLLLELNSANRHDLSV